MICGNYSGNGGYGLNLQLSGGSAYLGGPILTGNTSGEYLLGSGTISFGECPKEIIVEPPVVVPQPVFVEENGEHGFVPQNNIQSGEPPVCNGEKKVTLKAGDAYGLYEKLCGVNFQLNVVTGELLPGVLPSGYSYAGGVDAIISSGGSEVDELPSGGSITLKFPIPAGVDEASLVVLFWNGAEWADVPGGEVIDGYYVVTVEKPGNYVLATQ